MASFHSFAEMLEKKIRKQIENESTASESTSSSYSDLPSESWTRLVGEMGTYHFQHSQRGAVYHRNRPPAKPRPPHVLNEEQEKAWAFFQSHLEVPLPPNYNSMELKRSFRALALRLHPDHGGSSTQIRELLMARQQLEKVFA